MCYDEQLQELQRQTARKTYVETVLQELTRQEAALEKRVAELAVIKREEQADVERLQGRSLAAFFYRVVGRQDDKLEQEQREAYAAAVKYDAAALELESVQERIRQLKAERGRLRGCDEQYIRVLKEKADAIKRSGSPAANELIRIEKELGDLELEITELKEAVAEGQRAKSLADEVLSHLDEAEGFGIWDVAGGGVFVDMMKHGSLDEAQIAVERLQVQLRRFKTELADVAVDGDLQVQMDDFLRFADWFFDGLFADWAALDHIERAQTQAKQTRERIVTILDTLSRRLSDEERQRERKQEKRDALTRQTTV